eukprot:2336295-Prymnesium_polylepis.1
MAAAPAAAHAECSALMFAAFGRQLNAAEPPTHLAKGASVFLVDGAAQPSLGSAASSFTVEKLIEHEKAEAALPPLPPLLHAVWYCLHQLLIALRPLSPRRSAQPTEPMQPVPREWAAVLRQMGELLSPSSRVISLAPAAAEVGERIGNDWSKVHAASAVLDGCLLALLEEVMRLPQLSRWALQQADEATSICTSLLALLRSGAEGHDGFDSAEGEAEVTRRLSVSTKLSVVDDEDEPETEVPPVDM